MDEKQLIRGKTPNNQLTVQRKIAAVSILPCVNIHAERVRQTLYTCTYSEDYLIWMIT